MINATPGPGSTSSATPARVVVEPPMMRRLFFITLASFSGGIRPKYRIKSVAFRQVACDITAMLVRGARW